MFYFFISQSVLRFYFNALFYTAAQFFGFYHQNTIGIYQKTHFYLGQSCRHARDAGKVKFGELAVVFHHIPFALKHRYAHTALPIFLCSILPRHFGGYFTVAWHQHIHQSAHRFYAQAKRGNIEKQKIFVITCQYICLHRCTQRYYFIGIY